LGLIPENPIERAVLRLGLALQPLIETHLAYTLAREVMLGTKLGVFDALSDGEATPEQLAGRLGTEPRPGAPLPDAGPPTGRLAHALVAAAMRPKRAARGSW
jgi:hypothetical protein